jgi:hypothetical protein
MGNGIHTFHRVRHFSRPDPRGPRRLLWGTGIGETDGDGVPEDSLAYRRLNARGGLWVPNDLTDIGEQRLLEIVFRNATETATFYYRLFNDTPIDTDDTVADLTGELVMTGYPGTHDLTQDATGFPTSALDSGDWAVTGRTRTWTNGGGAAAGPVTHIVLATASTVTTAETWAWAALSASRTLQVSDSLDASMKLKAA